MKKRTSSKRFLATLLTVMLLIGGVALGEERAYYKKGGFAYSVPTSWLYLVGEDGFSYHFLEKMGDFQDGFLTVYATSLGADVSVSSPETILLLIASETAKGKPNKIDEANSFYEKDGNYYYRYRGEITIEDIVYDSNCLFVLGDENENNILSMTIISTKITEAEQYDLFEGVISTLVFLQGNNQNPSIDVNAMLSAFFYTMENVNVIIESKEITITTSSDENPITSYKCTPYKGLTLCANYQGGKLVSYTHDIDADSSYAFDKEAHSSLAFVMAACNYDMEKAASVFDYHFGNYVANDSGLVTEVESDGFTIKIVTSFKGALFISVCVE